jgi:hypothetical protein
MFPAIGDWGGIIAMTRLCFIGLFAAVLAVGPAWPAVLDGNDGRADKQGRDEGSATRLAFDASASRAATMLAPQGRSCWLSERVVASGTIQDVMLGPDGWSAGAIARVDNCAGVTDPSTGFAALFGDGKPPPACEHGSRFWASGTASSGFQPEFYLKVESIRCE